MPNCRIILLLFFPIFFGLFVFYTKWQCTLKITVSAESGSGISCCLHRGIFPPTRSPECLVSLSLCDCLCQHRRLPSTFFALFGDNPLIPHRRMIFSQFCDHFLSHFSMTKLTYSAQSQVIFCNLQPIYFLAGQNHKNFTNFKIKTKNNIYLGLSIFGGSLWRNG